ncbi:Dephospho-CoA kinase [Streptococcus parauberis]|nr:Dephospho-CoA kinase [Streptococcus parauberis]
MQEEGRISVHGAKNMTKIIGLTGGIASGKSTVVKEIRQAGYEVIDADQVVHELQRKGGRLYQALLNFFGPSILQEDGEIDRPKLSKMIFSSLENRDHSSRLQNQIIQEELMSRKEKLEAKGKPFFMDIPLLIELDMRHWFNEIWLVYVDQDTQKQRLMNRNHYSEQEARDRIASQMPLQEKLKFADIVIDNNGSLQELTDQIGQILSKLD